MRSEVEKAAGRSYEDPRPLPRFRIADHMGWHDQKDGKLYLGVPVPSGRISGTLRDAFWDVVTRYRPTIILAPSQDIIFGDIDPEDRDGVQAMLREHGVTLAQDLKPLQRWSLACPALPTCGLALTEAERIRQPVVDAVLAKLEARGLDRETISLRITGCPNGCARPYAGDIGLVGRMPGHFALYVGGDFEGTRLNFRLLDKVAEEEVPEMLDILFAAFAEHRQSIESFGDFCNRWGVERLIGAIDAAMPAVTI
jgi:sulfite reductase (ferredoxin)